MYICRISVAKHPYPYPYPFKQGNYYPYPIRIRENCRYPQNIYPWIHIRASLLVVTVGDQYCKVLVHRQSLRYTQHRNCKLN